MRDLITSNIKTSIEYLIQQRKEQRYLGNYSNDFIKEHLNKLALVIEGLSKLPYHKIFEKELRILNSKIEDLLVPMDKGKPVSDYFEPTTSFFGNKLKTNGLFLKELYCRGLDIELFNQNKTTADDFVQVLTSSKPSETKHQIHFQQENINAIYFLLRLQGYFQKLTWSKVSESKSFVSKGSTSFSQSTLDKYTTKIRKSEIEKFKFIDKIFSKDN